MLVSFGEGNELRFYRRTIARTYRLNLSVIEWGVCQAAAKHLVNFFVGVYRPARQLFQSTAFVHIAELIGSVLAWLYLQILEMYRTLIDTYGRSCLHTSRYDPMLSNAFREMWYCRFCNTTPSNHLPSDMHQAIQKGACRHNHAVRINLCTPNRPYADCPNLDLVRNRLY